MASATQQGGDTIGGSGKGRLLGWTPVAIAVLGVLIAAFFVLRPSSTPTMVGHPAPNFTVHNVNGGTVTLSALRGHPVLINFWGVECIYCRKEMPLLQQAYAQYHQRDGLMIIGVDVQGDDSNAITAFAGERNVTYPQFLQGTVDWAALYRVNDLPQSVFVDRQGIVRSFDPKPFLDAPTLQHSLQTIL